MKLLLCTISRNNAKRLKSWYNQINTFVTLLLEQHDVELSIYENDSNDGTKQRLSKYADRLSKRCTTTLTTTDLGTDHLVGQEGARVKNIANARNACMEQASDINAFDKIIFVETDVVYNPHEALQLIHHDADIVSGFTTNAMGQFYDAWATRKTSEETWWNHGIPTENTEVWSTFNGVCVYDAKAFQEGARFAGVNPRTGEIDCDTTVICEVFRAMNYDNIVMLPINVRHPPTSIKERLYYFKQQLLRRT
ncbi:MAG: hypothetical protein CMB25_04360 [Euryarchaeota archaeon]|nr:hypothetical protein [Euryarchaeota archaeon]